MPIKMHSSHMKPAIVEGESSNVIACEVRGSVEFLHDGIEDRLP